MSERRQFVVGITGASGAVYAKRLVELLAAADVDVHVIFSPYGRQLFADELDMKSPTPELLAGPHAARVQMHGYHDVGNKLGSGSFMTHGMVVCPTSSNTLAELAVGMGSNLITRAAFVHLKELRRLIVVPREIPLTQIELENMLRLSRAGCVICPAAPGFYMRPRSIEDLVDFVAGKVLDLLGVAHALRTRWAEQLEANRVRAREP